MKDNNNGVWWYYYRGGLRYRINADGSRTLLDTAQQTNKGFI
jgi:hypothetical protein